MSAKKRFNKANERLSPARFRYLHSLLDDVTPLKHDCGVLCGKICCLGLEDHAGMYLFPGEEALYPERADWYTLHHHATVEHEFCPDWDGVIDRVAFLECTGSCPRGLRPLACRLFPLAADPVAIPVTAPDKPDYSAQQSGVLWDIRTVLDFDAALLCPLVRHARLEDLNPLFVLRCQQVYSLLASDPIILKDMVWHAGRRRKDAAMPWAKMLR